MSTRESFRILAVLAAAIVIPACGSGGGSNGSPSTPFVVPAALDMTLAAAAPDQFQSATAGPAGSFLVAGFSGTGLLAGDPRLITVVKILPDGTLDTTFGGGDGIASTAFDFRGGNDELDIATQSTGKIIVSATVANAVNADDRDILILRLNADGSPDATFNALDTPGSLVLSLNSGLDAVANDGTAATLQDTVRGLAVDASGGATNDLIYLHAAQRAEGPGSATDGLRTDTDYVVIRLTVDGTLDLSFAGGDGKHLLDVGAASATPRSLKVLSNGSIIAGGYANTTIVGGKVQPVVYKLTSAGVLDSSFATGGVFHQTILTEQTEVYNFAIQGDDLVTAGYGRNSGTGPNNVWVSLRIDANSGGRDTNWGGAPNGAVLVDPSGGLSANNCHNAVALPGGKTLLLGSTGVTGPPGTRNAAFAVLNAVGVLDSAYGAGVHVVNLDPTGNDQFWGAAVSGNNVILVGYQGTYSAPSVGQNDNARALILPLR